MSITATTEIIRECESMFEAFGGIVLTPSGGIFCLFFMALFFGTLGAMFGMSVK